MLTEDQFKERIYDVMNGLYEFDDCFIPEKLYVRNEFAQGCVCEQEYDKVYNARVRICERLGVDEDIDVEIILNSFTTIAEHLSKTMYDYGVKFAQAPFMRDPV